MIKPNSLSETLEDLSLYNVTKNLLVEMRDRGNLASKDHLTMLEDIETLLDDISQRPETNDTAFLDPDVFQWIESIDELGDLPHLYQGSVGWDT